MAHIDESWHISTSHGTHEYVKERTNESWHMAHGTYHISTSHGTYQRVMAHINESWHISTSHGTHELQCVAMHCVALEYSKEEKQEKEEKGEGTRFLF